MNTFKSFRYLSVAVLLGTWGCSQKQVATKGDYDDLYGSSKDAPQVAYKTSTQPSNIYQNPDYTDNLRYQREETPATQAEGTDEYFDENYVNSRKVQRGYTSEPGYSSGFSDGYQSGWNDYAWSQPMGWASPFNRFGYSSPFGYNSFGGFGSGLSIGLGIGYGMGYGGFGNRFYDPFWGGGFGNRFYDPFWGGGMYSPYYSSFYSPWGNPYYNSFYSPYDYYGYGRYGGFGYPGYAYNVTSGVVGAAKNRTYGPRDGGRGSSYYNDRFNNTAIRNNDGGRRADANVRSTGTGRGYTGNDGYYAAPRRNGVDNSSFNNTANSRANSGNDTYYARPRRNGGYEGGNNGSGTRTYDYSRPSNSSTRSTGNSGYSNGSGNSRSSDSWSRSSSNSNNSSWSSPSRSSSSSSSSSSGGGSRGGSSGGGGGSRGPR